MRFGVGLAVLGVGVIGLGWWARVEYATHMQETLQLSAQAVVAESVHGVEARVEGRDIHITGLANGAAERNALVAALNEIRGRRVVTEDLEVLPSVDPFEMTAIWLDGRLQTQGYAPTRAGQAALAELGAEGLTLAAGAPDGQWVSAVSTAITVLRQLQEGQLAVANRRMSMSGVARTPDEGEAVRAALDGLPAGYQADLGLSYLDDGTPASYSLGYSAAEGGWVEGKLPPGLEAAALAEALGLREIEDTATQGILGDTGQVPAALSALAPWMAEFETLDIAVSPDGTEIQAGFGAGADLDLLRSALEADLAGAATLTVLSVTSERRDGAERVNAATGQTEVLRGGFWLPMPEFAPSSETCVAETDAVLARNHIGFVTGSARLDARARSAVNALASVLGVCLRDADLQAEIGGHTDSTGSDEANLALSLARAEAVRVALVARGVPEAALRAAGYGATQPIADNETEDGRAANRRTAVRWVE
ncbi:OmpA family protein [Pararhodobacter sp.]|uniref:OmpA family protein n=1 Tax=Pararhodobacter sp. TaxID=2127056 RepID=UPI002AFF2AAB|nr:OmpA family protein [Pararhodobacter sp.]